MNTVQVGTGLGNDYGISGMRGSSLAQFILLGPITTIRTITRASGRSCYSLGYPSHSQNPLFCALTPILGSLLLELASLIL